MNKRSSDKKLIKEYVATVLAEMYDTDGMGSGGGSDLFNTFVKPFTDVIGTAVGKTKEVFRRGITLLNVAFESLVTALVPFLTDSYDEIFEKEKADIAKIRSEYQSYYDSTAQALGSDDVKLLAFFAFPGAALTGKFVKDAPKAAKGILSVATGGLSDEYLGSSAPSRSKRSPSSVFDSYARSYNKLLKEAEEGANTESSLADKLGNKKFVDALIKKSPVFNSAERESKEIFQKNLNARIEPILKILSIKNAEELGKILGKPIKKPDLEKLGAEKKLSAQEAEAKFLESAKKTSVQAAIKELKNYVSPVRDAFGDDHPFVKAYDSAISAIESGDEKRLAQIKNQLGLGA